MQTLLGHFFNLFNVKKKRVNTFDYFYFTIEIFILIWFSGNFRIAVSPDSIASDFTSTVFVSFNTASKYGPKVSWISADESIVNSSFSTPLLNAFFSEICKIGLILLPRLPSSYLHLFLIQKYIA